MRQALHDNLYRFVTNDDVDLWAVNWDPTFASAAVTDAAAWLPPDPDSRARLGWILRSLLRAGVPIVERAAIGNAFLEAARRSPSRLEALSAVRRAVYPAVAGPDGAAEAVALPEELAARLAAGVSDTRPHTWEMPRQASVQLLRDVNQWRGAGTGEQVTVIKVVRPVERLPCAAPRVSRPHVYVVAEEEIP